MGSGVTSEGEDGGAGEGVAWGDWEVVAADAGAGLEGARETREICWDGAEKGEWWGV